MKAWRVFKGYWRGVLLFSLAASAAQASPYESRLWLPVSLDAYRQKLLQAADIVAKDPQCLQLIEGTMAEVSLPTFLFRCRTPQREHIRFSVNAQTLKVVNLSVFHKEQAAKRKYEERLADEAHYWLGCQRVLDEKISMFARARITSSMPPAPEISKDSVSTYFIEFESISSKGNVLRFSARATTAKMGECEIDVQPL